MLDKNIDQMGDNIKSLEANKDEAFTDAISNAIDTYNECTDKYDNSLDYHRTVVWNKRS
jgi:hypothetical protein